MYTTKLHSSSFSLSSLLPSPSISSLSLLLHTTKRYFVPNSPIPTSLLLHPSPPTLLLVSLLNVVGVCVCSQTAPVVIKTQINQVRVTFMFCETVIKRIPVILLHRVHRGEYRRVSIRLNRQPPTQSQA